MRNNRRSKRSQTLYLHAVILRKPHLTDGRRSLLLVLIQDFFEGGSLLTISCPSALMRGWELIRINTVNINRLQVGFKFIVIFFIEFFSISSFNGSALFNQCDYK